MPRAPYILLLIVFCVFVILYSSNNENSNQPVKESIVKRVKPTRVREKTKEIPKRKNAELEYIKKVAYQATNNVGRAHHSRQQNQPYSAFEFDDYVIVTSSISKSIGSGVFCRYLDENGKEMGKPFPSIVFPIFTVWCEKRSEFASISITDEENQPIKNGIVPILRNLEEPAHELSFCIAPIYGKEPKWLQIAELFEHYKLQGVTRFFVYIREMSDYDQKMIDSYVSSGEAEIILVPPTVPDVIAQQLMGVSDCLARTKKFSKWSIFADIDERLMMTDEKMTIAQYLSGIDDESIGAVAFPQRWIMKREVLPPKFIDDDQVLKNMPTQRWTETSSAAVKPHPACRDQKNCWGKNIVRPEKVMSMLVHEVDIFSPGAKERFLQPTVGYIRHYRDVHMQDWESNNMKLMKQFGSFSNTTYPETYGEPLQGYNDFFSHQDRLSNLLFANYNRQVSPVYTLYELLTYNSSNLPEKPKRFPIEIKLYYLKVADVDVPEEKVTMALELVVVSE
ncbi:unnamed protein product [Caenorhabditis auriculariae]|uniref:Glycosyltransferase family 92 protein n=1 Tax=Caenorhabditis auriculariae TaxID=2777116 RepID=A0A8S1HPX0_9PELO|nr:unnamed protein product [Caenorhabditis auriculariae]